MMKSIALILHLVLFILPGNILGFWPFEQSTSPELCKLGCECPESGKTLMFLDCTRKGIQKLPWGITLDKKLMKVSFQGNNLRFLKMGTFYRADNVEELDLSLNGLLSVDDSIFIGFPSLAELHLSHNHITSLSRGLLDGLDNLRFLDLGNNRLESIPKDFFDATRNIRELRLRHNSLNSLHEDTFKGLHLLERLDLENTGLMEMHQEIFQFNRNLKWLSLIDNSLNQVPTEVFKRTTKLSSLDLSGNSFEFLSPGSFATLTNLSHLTVNRLTHLTTIGRHAFVGMANLKSLSCSYNGRLTTIHPEAFGQNATIPHEQLFLHHNNLRSLSINISHLEQLSYLDLRENPWTCDCKMMWMADLKLEIKNSVRCNSPVGLKDQTLASVTKEQLICSTWLLSNTLLVIGAALAFVFCLLAAAVTFCPRSPLGLRIRSRRQFQYAKVIPRTNSIDLEWDPTGEI